jgi:hypothetical protein
MPGMVGGHQCGPAHAFLEGVPFDPTADPIPVDVDWIPLCCPRNPVGGAKAGAAAAGELVRLTPLVGSSTAGSRAGGRLVRVLLADGSAIAGSAADGVELLDSILTGNATAGGAAGGAARRAVLLTGDAAAGGAAGGAARRAARLIGNPAVGNPAAGFVALRAILAGVSVAGSDAEGELNTGPPPGEFPFTNGVFTGENSAYLCNDGIGIWTASNMTFAASHTTSQITIAVWTVGTIALTGVRWGLSATMGQDDIAGGTLATSGVFDHTNGYGLDVYKVTIPVVVTLPAGTYWLTIFDIASSAPYFGYWDSPPGTTDGYQSYVDLPRASEYFKIE